VPGLGVTLLVYLRDEEPWAAAFLDSVDDIVFLEDEGESPQDTWDLTMGKG
jgi:hypothetical protein